MQKEVPHQNGKHEMQKTRLCKSFHELCVKWENDHELWLESFFLFALVSVLHIGIYE